MADKSIDQIFNFRAVDAKVATAGQPREDQIRMLAQAGFEVIINLALHDDPRYSLRDEAGLVRSLGMEYVHIPVQFGAPTEGDLRAFFEAMERHKGRKLLIHCAANKRVTAFLGLYRVMRQHWNKEEAFRLMREVWEADEVWSSFISSMLETHQTGK